MKVFQRSEVLNLGITRAGLPKLLGMFQSTQEAWDVMGCILFQRVMVRMVGARYSREEIELFEVN